MAATNVSPPCYVSVILRQKVIISNQRLPWHHFMGNRFCWWTDWALEFVSFRTKQNIFKISNKRGTEGVKGFWIFTIRKEFEISDGNFVADRYFMFWERLFMTCDPLVLLLYIVTIKTYFYSIVLFIPSWTFLCHNSSCCNETVWHFEQVQW